MMHRNLEPCTKAPYPYDAYPYRHVSGCPSDSRRSRRYVARLARGATRSDANPQGVVGCEIRAPSLLEYTSNMIPATTRGRLSS